MTNSHRNHRLKSCFLHIDSQRLAPSKSNTHYIIVRDDLSRGVQAAMIVHAAGESATDVQRGTFAVVLGAQDEAHLNKLEKRLQLQSIPHAAFREPDRNYELMSIGINPVEDRRTVRRFLRGFPILGGNSM